VVATGRQKTWVYGRLADLQQAGLAQRASPARYRLAQHPDRGWSAEL